MTAASAPEQILDAWTALEVLSPQTFRRPEDLASGDRARVAWLEHRLPWEGAGEKSRPRCKLYYQVVLGSIDRDPTFVKLLASFGDTRPDRPPTPGEAVLALVTLDQRGHLIEPPATSISSFGWGVPRVLEADFAALPTWSSVESPLLEELDTRLRRAKPDEEPPALDRASLDAGFRWLVKRLGLPPNLVKPPRFAIRCFESFASSDPPEPLLLNSFFLGDLQKSKRLFSQGRAPNNLQLYLGCKAPGQRTDLLHDRSALESAIAPHRVPPARWPGPGRHSLVLLQQAAVNLALTDLEKRGLLAVNGPPGTGKTTLLRDLVAAIVTARAEAMVRFDNPVDAFSHSGQKLKSGPAWLHLYRLDPRLKGFEMIAASSNNKAVENVSAALPALDAIASEASDQRYLRTVSDALLEKDTWGLAAAVLGNVANRSRFRNTFWWDPDVGLSTYLAEAAGTPQSIEVVDPETGKTTTRRPRIVTEEKAPSSPEEALIRWKKARGAFRTALRQSRESLKELEEVRQKAAALPGLINALEDLEATLLRHIAAEKLARQNREEAVALLDLATVEFRQQEAKLASMAQRTPGVLSRIFRTEKARIWDRERAPVEQALAKAKSTYAEALSRHALVEAEHRRIELEREKTRLELSMAADRLSAASLAIELARQMLGDRLVGAEFFDRSHQARQMTVPWLAEEQQRLRDDVFLAAMQLHRTFLDAAAKPLRHNLGALMSVFGGRRLPTLEKQALLPDLWASLFLVVPLISTTFASVERMLGDLPSETFGWLFIDEAGQALPQAAVGALFRTRRAVVVGDPVQIEPIVGLPDRLTHAICQHFHVDPNRWNAPAASAQTVADTATAYMASFEGRFGSREVGVPLLVHRRCSEPMFGISNAVAYEQLMVQAKGPRASKIGDVLGPSYWFDVRSGGSDKWCPEEGKVVLDLLGRLAAANVEPDLYIVSPFALVAQNLRAIIRESTFLSPWIEDLPRWTAEHVGTVHTVQGREAEAVLFVLGAPTNEQAGARNWAGGSPNLLNVAVTRAKERLYVVGNRSLWREAGVFRSLDQRMGRSS